MNDMPRDLVGYGANPPDITWPNGARVAVNFVMNFEEGSEYAIGNGDGRSEASLTEVAASRVPRGERDLAAESMFEYGSRIGFWRLRRVFQERGVPLTVFACAQALERHPPAAEAIREAGWDICCHGWRWVEHYLLSEAEEREHIARAVASLEETLGAPPAGWYCRYGPSVNTRRLVVAHGGFLYDSDAYNDDLPYWTTVDGAPHLVVPYSLVNNDAKLTGLVTGEDFERFLRDALDLLRHEADERASMMSVGMHMRLLGHPARASGLARFLDYVGGLSDVWIAGRADIARHFSACVPAPA